MEEAADAHTIEVDTCIGESEDGDDQVVDGHGQLILDILKG